MKKKSSHNKKGGGKRPSTPRNKPTKDRDSNLKSKDRDSNSKSSKDRDSNSKPSKDRDTKGRYSSSKPSKDRDSNSKPSKFSDNKRFKSKHSTAENESKPRELNKRPVVKTGFKMDEKIRINRFLSNSGVCSRREADKYISSGCVTVNGKIVSELGTKVSLSDDVRFNGEQLNPQSKVYLLLNKPKGFVTTTDDPQERKTVMDLIDNACNERIYPVGRLDKTTTGLLMFTNDGDLAKKLTHPSHNKKKIYHVFLDKALTKAHLIEIAQGITLEDGEIAADSINYANDEDKREVGIEIHSGKNRIVRRIFAHLGYEVQKLDRVYFAGLTKKNLPRGKWRFLTPVEINQLKMQ